MEKKDKYIITISILIIFLIISIGFNILGYVLIKDKDEIIRGCRYEYDWASRMIEERK